MYSGCIGQVPNSYISSCDSDCSVVAFIPLHLSTKSSASEPSAFGISTESSASGSIISATSAPNSSDSGQLSVSISYVCTEIWGPLRDFRAPS